MKSVTKNLVFAAAAAGLVFAPVAAQANTRASDSNTVYAPSTAPGQSRSSEGNELEGESGLIVLLLAASSIIAAIILIHDSNGAN